MQYENNIALLINFDFILLELFDTEKKKFQRKVYLIHLICVIFISLK